MISALSGDCLPCPVLLPATPSAVLLAVSATAANGVVPFGGLVF